MGDPALFQGEEQLAVDPDNWFDTGDVAVLHPDGTMQITDRAKDVIKSGGEWISSVELENAAVGCAGVAEAAAIGVYPSQMGRAPDPAGGPQAGQRGDDRGDQAHLEKHVAKWWLPDEILFVDEPAAHRHRQAAQDRAPRAVQGLQAGGGLVLLLSQEHQEAISPTPPR